MLYRIRKFCAILKLIVYAIHRSYDLTRAAVYFITDLSMEIYFVEKMSFSNYKL